MTWSLGAPDPLAVVIVEHFSQQPFAGITFHFVVGAVFERVTGQSFERGELTFPTMTPKP
jgi:hypothetical protein